MALSGAGQTLSAFGQARFRRRPGGDPTPTEGDETDRDHPPRRPRRVVATPRPEVPRGPDLSVQRPLRPASPPKIDGSSSANPAKPWLEWDWPRPDNAIVLTPAPGA